ncbi:zinc finger protein 385B isoform X2 [Clupea harengus]|nr:zinc finger protein 385B isoform X2 [Clupea harengus]XP_031442137.1 zinc finger protein 385B isoform X2 [Clupea harengus]XP_031442139.1 zinc finger protein 385B isoform X2 [Clupea harengus]
MKTPLSPTQLFDNGRFCFPYGACLEVKEVLQGDGQADMQLQQEKKKLLFSLCEVCNIQLNSAAQAQVHYNGKSHLKRVKQLNNGEMPPATSTGPLLPSLTLTTSSCSLGCIGNTGSSCHSNSLPTLVRTPSLMMQSTLDMKPFMPFQVDTSSPVGLFPNFNTMDPVQKAVINHTFGVSIPPKKKHVISCNICQLRFNSDSQAEAHYKGSKHAKKLKAQESTKNKQKSAAATPDSAKTITTSSTTSTSSTAVTASNSDQPEKLVESPSAQNASISPKAFLPASPLMATSTAVACAAVVLAPGFCKPALESAPVGSPPEPTAPGPTPKTPTKPASVATALAAGLATVATAAEPSAESEEEKAKKLLYCSLCKVAVNSLSQLEAHNTGSKHKTMLEARSGAGPIKAYPRPGSKLKTQVSAVLKGSGLQNKTFHCEICDVHVNSEIQLKQHISSRRHKDRVAGKPLKPKYSPYNKQQRSSTILAAKLALQKDLVKPISTAFISNPFAPTTMPSITLHPRPSASIFQTATLPPSFLRAAPGPIRPTTGSILFAPY